MAKTGRPPRVASCEPCRLSKLACDHRYPCSRCISRDITADCLYRKNAFKRVRSIPSPRPGLVFESPPSSQATGTDLPVPVSPYPNPGFQGSSSLNTVLDDLRQQTSLLGNVEYASPSPSLSTQVDGMVNPPVRSVNNTAILEGAQLLELLLSSTTGKIIERVFSQWKGNGLESHVSAFLVKPFVDAITAEMSQFHQSKDWKSELLNFSRRLFENTRQPVNIHQSMTLQHFVDQYTGSNLRWEAVGLILTLTGIAATEFRAPDIIFVTEDDRHALRRNMIHFANKCVSFCESLDALNDVQVIFLYETFQMDSVFYGDQSVKTWRRLNDAVGAFLAAGLHEDVQEGHSVPFFLMELRKRIFARLYAIDISLATFLGRPPRMSKRFCCINLPLDLDEDLHLLTGDAVDQRLRMLDQNGWNTQGRIRPSAMVRWSMITAMIREDTLEILLARKTADMQSGIDGLRCDIGNSWNNLPSFLKKSSEEIWLRGRSRQETECLHMIRLSYLQTAFLIEWAAWRHSIERSHRLFQAANDILCWVNESLVRREQLSNTGFISLAWRVASCSLPAAGALALYLLQPSPQRTLFEVMDTRSRLQSMRNLSVLIAHIDILHSPSDGNFQLFCQAKRSLLSVMDMLLKPGNNAGQLASPSSNVIPNLSNIDMMVSEYCGFNGGFWDNFPDCLYAGETDSSMAQQQGLYIM